jgi:hypothetical protein
MKFGEFQSLHRRLAILRALLAAAQYRLNAVMLRSFVEAMGFPTSADLLRADLAWLEEQGLVALHQVEQHQIAALTERGNDVATGRAVNPGVQRPEPDA